MSRRPEAAFSPLRIAIWLALIVAAVLLVFRGLLPALEEHRETAELHARLEREVAERERELERIRVRIRALRDRDRLAVIRALVQQGWSREGYRLVKPAPTAKPIEGGPDSPPKRR